MHPDRPGGSKQTFQAVQEAFKQGMAVATPYRKKDQARRRAGT